MHPRVKLGTFHPFPGYQQWVGFQSTHARTPLLVNLLTCGSLRLDSSYSVVCTSKQSLFCLITVFTCEYELYDLQRSITILQQINNRKLLIKSSHVYTIVRMKCNCIYRVNLLMKLLVKVVNNFCYYNALQIRLSRASNFQGFLIKYYCIT